MRRYKDGEGDELVLYRKMRILVLLEGERDKELKMGMLKHENKYSRVRD